MNYTAHQQEAIEARGEDLLISAAAGSGKTRVLVDRIVHMMVHDRVPLAEMLIVTFTNAAAGEMRARLRQGLQDAVAAAADEEAKAFLIAQLEELPDAHISTMHAFCISELRRFYHVLALDPNFKILPETTTTILREDALEEAMDAAYAEGDEKFLNLVAAYGGATAMRRCANWCAVCTTAFRPMPSLWLGWRTRRQVMRNQCRSQRWLCLMRWSGRAVRQRRLCVQRCAHWRT